MKKIIYLILGFCAVGIFSFNQTDKKNESVDSFKALNNYLAGEIKDGRLKGVHGLVFHNGTVVYDHFFGERDAESKDPM